MRSNVGWSNNTPASPIRAALVEGDQLNVEVDGDQLMITALGIERLRVRRSDAATLARLLEARLP